jgi:hypothetical protein
VLGANVAMMVPGAVATLALQSVILRRAAARRRQVRLAAVIDLDVFGAPAHELSMHSLVWPSSSSDDVRRGAAF